MIYMIYITCLMLPNVEMVHIDEGNCVSVLVVVEQDTNFVEQQLYIEFWNILVRFVMHLDLYVCSGLYSLSKRGNDAPFLHR